MSVKFQALYFAESTNFFGCETLNCTTKNSQPVMDGSENCKCIINTVNFNVQNICLAVMYQSDH
jgi:hypothetical protein